MTTCSSTGSKGGMMLEKDALNVLFCEARTHHKWTDKEVPDDLLRRLYDLAVMGPTSMNCCPMRIVFVTSAAAKEKLKPTLMEGNVEKTMSAPVTAILAYDQQFYQKLPQLFPHMDAMSWFEGNASFAEETAFRNATLQGGYFILAARSLGLDCGPMSGFDAKALDQAFFKGTQWKSNFLCNLGYGDPTALYPRGPRPTFEETCKIS